jgi:hypothetical protein
MFQFHTVTDMLGFLFQAVSKLGKVHPRTGHEGPEGE